MDYQKKKICTIHVQGLLGSLLNKKGGTISSVPPSRNKQPTQLRLEVIDEASIASDNISTEESMPPLDAQSTAPTPKPATPTKEYVIVFVSLCILITTTRCKVY